jgi:hypothetical protein
MSKYAFIDESGTMPKDQIMTVALKVTIKAALMDFDDLIINIGRQGGSRQYETALIKELQRIPESFIERGLFKKAKFSLLSASNAGIQLADFYASASRSYFLSKFTSVSGAPYAKVAHQIVHLSELGHLSSI